MLVSWWPTQSSTCSFCLYASSPPHSGSFYSVGGREEEGRRGGREEGERREERRGEREERERRERGEEGGRRDRGEGERERRGGRGGSGGCRHSLASIPVLSINEVLYTHLVRRVFQGRQNYRSRGGGKGAIMANFLMYTRTICIELGGLQYTRVTQAGNSIQ